MMLMVMFNCYGYAKDRDSGWTNSEFQQSCIEACQSPVSYISCWHNFHMADSMCMCAPRIFSIMCDWSSHELGCRMQLRTVCACFYVCKVSQKQLAADDATEIVVIRAPSKYAKKHVFTIPLLHLVYFFQTLTKLSYKT